MKKFNVRVYGILINDQKQVLVSDELIKKQNITKFPGGGLEFGEGTIDCLKREFMEELNLKIEVITHFYTTDFFQRSAFHPDHQIISIYYLVKSDQIGTIKTMKNAFDFIQWSNDEQLVRWINLDSITENEFTLPIDKIVAAMLRNNIPNYLV
ncbi:MAG: NUDIX domain-containing protein [Bacteroidia bacterium]